MDLEQFEVQRSWRAGCNPAMPALLTAIHNQDEIPVATDFDRDTPTSRALWTMRQASVGVRHKGELPAVSRGHRNTIGGASAQL
jgi:hypothetical protein